MAEPLKATFFALQRRERAVLLPAALITLALLAPTRCLGTAIQQAR